MQIIPVIDLMGGQVVHARRGDRARYRRLRSALCDSSQPGDVVAALTRLHPFTNLYVADLDAIAGQGDNRQCIQSLAHDHPRLRLWIDRGVRHRDQLEQCLHARLGRVVIGSESLSDMTLVADPVFTRARHEIALSLDFKHRRLLGPPKLLARPDLWPHRIIVMTLARVGSASGPDLDQIRCLQSLAPDRAWYAAGGVRHANDLAALAKLEVAGVLVASALHGGDIDADVLARFD